MPNHADNAADSAQIMQAGAASIDQKRGTRRDTSSRVRRPKSSFGNGLRPEGDRFSVSP
jgi:hypothetical protein